MEGKIVVKNPNASSKVWEHFGLYKMNNQILKEKAVCRICNQEYKYTGGTTNLNQHLQKYHKDVIEEASTSKELGGKKSIQCQITSLMKQPITVKPRSPKYKLYTEAVAEYLVGCLVPLSTVDNKHFKKMIAMVSGHTYEPPSRKYFTETLLPKMMKETSQKMMSEVQSIHGIGITTDAWTSLATEGYVTYTAHYVTDDWELKSRVLSTQSTDEKHTAENLAKDMEATEEKWGIN